MITCRLPQTGYRCLMGVLTYQGCKCFRRICDSKRGVPRMAFPGQGTWTGEMLWSNVMVDFRGQLGEAVAPSYLMKLQEPPPGRRLLDVAH